MNLLEIIVGLVVVGFILWVINTYIPMDAKIKQLLNVVVAVILVVWLLKAFGVWAYLGHIRT